MSPLHSRGSPMPSVGSKIRSGPKQRGTKSEMVASPLPSRGPKKRAEMLCHPCILGSPTPNAASKIRSSPQQRGTKSQVAASPLPSRGPKRGRKCYITPAFSGIPNVKRGEQNQKWSPTEGNKIRSGYLTPAFSGAQKEGGNATSPLHSRESPTPRTRRKISPTKGEKIRRGGLTPVFSGAQKRAEMLRNPRVLGGPRTGVQKGPSPGEWKKASHGGPR